MSFRIRMLAPVSLCALIVVSGGLQPLFAAASEDEILTEIETGIEAYKEKDYRGAVESLRFAVAKIQKHLDEEYKKLLPEPLPGWTADEPKVHSAAMAMLGGGTSLSRRYRKGETTVTVDIAANSQMIAMM